MHLLWTSLAFDYALASQVWVAYGILLHLSFVCVNNTYRMAGGEGILFSS